MWKDGCEPWVDCPLFCLVRYDGLGKPSIERFIPAMCEDEAEAKLGGLPPSEEYVAGRLGGCDVYRSNDYQVVGPFDCHEEAVLYIEC